MESFDDGNPNPASVSIENAVDQSEAFTTHLMRATATRNPCLGGFIQKENTETCLAARHIVSMACETGVRRGDEAWNISYPNPAPLYGTEFMFAYTQIFQELSVESRRKFVRLIDQSMNHDPSDRFGPRFGRATVPSTENDAYRICLRGSHGVTPSLPLPRTVTVGSPTEQHVCVHPLDVVEYAFATLPPEILSAIPLVARDSVPPVPPGSVRTYYESSDYTAEVADTVSALRKSPFTATLLVTARWFSDGWDPNSTKDNRNGVWSLLMTVMFGPHSGLKEVVFPLAVGPKSGDHSPAIQWVLQEIRKLSEFVVVRDVPNRRNVLVRLCTALIQVDRLERGELWGGLNHASNRGKSHGVVAGYDTVAHDKYPSCPKCVKQVLKKLLEDHDITQNSNLLSCCECASYDPTSSLLTGPLPAPIAASVFPSVIDPHARFPTNSFASVINTAPWQPPHGRPVPTRDPSLPDSPRDIPLNYGPVRVDQVFLMVSCRFVAYHTWKGNITTKTLASAWADVCGVSHSVMLPIFEEARHHREMKTEDFSLVFTKELLPPIWLDSSWRLEKFLHAPMHLLFLGLTKKVLEMIDEWLALHSLKSSFNTASSCACDSTGKKNLDWLKLLKYGVSTLSRGLWVSEQYLAYSKFMLIPMVGICLSKAPHTEELKSVMRVIDSLSVLLSLVMRRTVDAASISRSKLAIQLYLFAIDDFGKLLFVSSNKKGVYSPVSLSNPNHASLIGMVSSMYTHGPPCDMWDGKEGCEASIQTMKKYFVSTCMVEGSSITASLNRYYRERGVGDVGAYIKRNGGTLFRDQVAEEPRDRFGGFFAYAKIEDVTRILEGNEQRGPGYDVKGAVSGLLFENDRSEQKTCVTVRRQGVSTFYEVSFRNIQSVGQLFGDKLQSLDRQFANEFLCFGDTVLCTEPFLPNQCGYRLISKVCLVSGRHVWNDATHCHVPDGITLMRKMFTVVSDDYRRLSKEGRLSERVSLCNSLWRDIASLEGDFVPTDWKNLLPEQNSDLYSLTVAQLKGILREHGERLSGRKQELVERVTALYESLPPEGAEVAAEEPSPDERVETGEQALDGLSVSDTVGEQTIEASPVSQGRDG